ncbi:MAG: hypothetical protein ACE3L7_05090 [Candidatus Pristimantibacillus sp.]
MFNYLRNKKIRRIFSRFPNVKNTELGWLINDLNHREERLLSDLHLQRTMDKVDFEKRIALIVAARNIMVNLEYKKNSDHCSTVKKVYEPFLK